MKQMDRICFDIIQVYRDITQTTKFVNVFSPAGESEFEDRAIQQLIHRYKKSKSKKVYPTDYKHIEFKFIVPYHISPYINALKTTDCTFKKLVSRNKTGLFKMTFSDGSILLVGRWLEGFGKNMSINTLVIGESATYGAYLQAFEQQANANRKPKAGIMRASMGQFGLEYYPIDNLPGSPVIHPKVDEILGDIKYYYEHVDLFTRYKQNGARKFMLISEPGTGKSSLFYKIAKTYEKEKSIVFCTDISAAAKHMANCAKHSVSTLIFIEDADSALGDNPGNSGVLNFLDGVDTPFNSAGSLIMMSTNYPEKIEQRILTRPGRIDKIYTFQALDGDWAIKCADLYFSEFFDVKANETEFLPIVTGMTGAQIKELSLASMSFAASKGTDISIPLIEEVKSVFAKNLSEAYKYAEANSVKKLTGKGRRIGFGQEVSSNPWE